MMGKSPATIAPQRGQSTVNGGRSCAVIALTSQPPVAQVFMPQQRWIEGPLSGAFPPGREMGQVLADDLHGGGCAMLAIVWQYFNAVRENEEDYAKTFLIIAPNVI